MYKEVGRERHTPIYRYIHLFLMEFLFTYLQRIHVSALIFYSVLFIDSLLTPNVQIRYQERECIPEGLGISRIQPSMKSSRASDGRATTELACDIKMRDSIFSVRASHHTDLQIRLSRRHLQRALHVEIMQKHASTTTLSTGCGPQHYERARYGVCEQEPIRPAMYCTSYIEPQAESTTYLRHRQV